MIKVIGLCGHSGAGKGFVCQCFSKFEIPSVDTDNIYHNLILPSDGSTSDCVSELANAFGDEIINKDYSLNRTVLGNIVFNSKESLKKLNSITHKYIKNETLKIIDKFNGEGAKALIVDAPALFESDFYNICDYKVLVTCPFDISIDRIVKRDGISISDAEKRLSNQFTDEYLRTRCDFEIINDGNSDIESQISTFISKFNL